MQLSTYLAPPPTPLRAANDAVPLPEPMRHRRAAAIVPFRPAARRRRSAEAHERRGEILLFLGVRYSRAS
ncbi:hypothetical protein [Methylobacterium radiodurans]|uniref:Uncharacterized protein n=1 Tax=Methylobacterium radiodurans TaxID=2202828 RepID=A0A2U8VLK6_9HYPH|nr:hypothetical protein [Methylobacterium radiodurans]AWN34535.1 hypothetical protein DK427_01250 [Methylobacterium radiodurans]